MKTILLFATSLLFFLPVQMGFAQSQEAGQIAVPEPKPKTGGESDKSIQNEEPARVYQSACPAVLTGRIQAVRLSPIGDGECGERSPLEISSMGNIGFTSNPVLNCRMASQLARWLPEASRLAENIFGSKIARIQSSTSYQCRRRNNAETGKISEHGFANALDIVGFELESGRKVSVLEGWPLSQPEAETQTEEAEPGLEAEFLRLVHAAACNKFTTVLGPDSNPQHSDHFHFDLGCHGKRCLYRICE